MSKRKIRYIFDNSPKFTAWLKTMEDAGLYLRLLLDGRFPDDRIVGSNARLYIVYGFDNEKFGRPILGTILVRATEDAIFTFHGVESSAMDADAKLFTTKARLRDEELIAE